MVESCPTAVLIPVKAFGSAKARLASVLDDITRAQLARSMATIVVHAAGNLPVSVVCDDEEVAEWAGSLGATVIWRPGRGLNGAVNDGVDELAGRGFERVIVSHADLPGASSLGSLTGFEGVVLIPDRHDDGTNVMSIPTGSGFVFTYGPRSFSHHQTEALRLGLRVQIVRDLDLGWDIDTPSDLSPPEGVEIPESVSQILRSVTSLSSTPNHRSAIVGSDALR